MHYGAAKLPTPGGRPGRDYHIYTEPLSAAKHRCYIRARELHPVGCEKREQAHEITENGDLWVTHAFTDFGVHGKTPNYVRRPFIVNIPSYGHFVHGTLELDDVSVRAGASLDLAEDYPEREEADRQYEYYWLSFPNNGLTQGGSSFSYTIRHGCANCMNMTGWEALERARYASDQLAPDFDKEKVGARIVFPVKTLVLKLKFPPSLAGVQPYVECLRPPQYPAYKTDAYGDAELHPGEWEIDSKAQDEEQQNLRYEAKTSTWVLTVERPIVGYQYALSWRLPSDTIDIGIKESAREWQRVLLELGDRIDAGTATANDRKAIKQFDLLCKTLEVEVRRTIPGEKQTVALLIYDPEKLALRPVFSRRSWTDEELPRDFEIPYGDGVSGAAFQQRRIIAWTSGEVIDPKDAASSLITPVDYPDASDGSYDAVNVLALPVCDVGSEDGRRPPPWAAIGVVTIDSSSYASPISQMDDKQLLFLRAAAQAQMDSIVRAVWG